VGKHAKRACFEGSEELQQAAYLERFLGARLAEAQAERRSSGGSWRFARRQQRPLRH
jgi:hypothetical protein